MLVPEEAGGGSISGNGVADLLIVARLFGHHAAPGPLLGTNVVAAALGRWGSAEQREGPLADLISGEAVAAWGHTSTAVSPAASRSVVLATTLDAGVVLSGRVPIVEGASDGTHLLVSASGTDGRSQYLMPLTAPGVELTRLNSVDLTRRYDDVVLRDVLVPADAIVGAPGAADDHDASCWTWPPRCSWRRWSGRWTGPSPSPSSGRSTGTRSVGRSARTRHQAPDGRHAHGLEASQAIADARRGGGRGRRRPRPASR